jgi:hypothetical protein
VNAQRAGRWVGIASAFVVLAIRTSFILVARGGAVCTLTPPRDIAWVCVVFSRLVVLRRVRQRVPLPGSLPLPSRLGCATLALPRGIELARRLPRQPVVVVP